MGIIARRFRWLQELFPPAAADPLNPNEISEFISLVHSVLQGTESLDEVDFAQTIGAAGGAVIIGTTVQNGLWRWIFDCDVSHDDPVARETNVRIEGQGGLIAVVSATALPTNERLPVPRGFLIAQQGRLSANVPAIAAGQKGTLRYHFLDFRLGAPAPPGA